jgi:cellulose synthase/poly-beta-1,6-N-acetylglucosamine synthase-like glycosyltransferase
MNQVSKWKEMISNTFNGMLDAMTEIIPKLLAALLIVAVGLLITKLIVTIVKKALRLVKADKLDDKLNEIELFGDKKLEFNIIKIIAQFIKWVCYIFLLIIVAEVLNLSIVTQEISKLLGYLPQLLTAFIILVFGLLLANAIKKAVKSFFESAELSGGKIISQLIFTIILVFVSITALNQAGVDTAIITDNITLIFTGFVVAFALAFGLGARNIVESLLKTYYARRTYEIGQLVKFNNIVGEIEAINSTTVTIKTNTGKLIIPIKDLSDNQVEIHK